MPEFSPLYNLPLCRSGINPAEKTNRHNVSGKGMKTASAAVLAVDGGKATQVLYSPITCGRFAAYAESYAGDYSPLTGGSIVAAAFAIGGFYAGGNYAGGRV